MTYLLIISLILILLLVSGIILFKPVNNIYNNTNLNNDVNKLLTNGYLIIPNVVSHKDCDEILNIISETEKTENVCGPIHSNVNRKDMMLPVDNMKKYIKDIYKKTKHIWNKVTPDPILSECSSLISYPGSYPQIWHTDTFYKKGDSNLVSIGVALQDIDKKMGPLHVYKNSVKIYKNNKKYEKKYGKNFKSVDVDDDKQGLYPQLISKICRKLNFKKVQCVSKKGDIIIWLSSIVHRGSSNISAKTRSVFYFSLLGNDGTKPGGATYSLLEDNKKIYVNNIV